MSLANDDPETIPSTPSNLASTVHSHEVELSWTPSIDDGLVVGYNIIRDGVVVEGLLDKISFLDNMLEPLTTYQYSVVAVDDDGNESIPSNVEVTTLDGQPLPPIINRSNYVELLRHVFDIYTGNAYSSVIGALPDWSDTIYVDQLNTSLVEMTVYCLNGGTIRFTPFYFDDGDSNYRSWWDFEFTDCQDGAVVLDGQLRRETWGGRASGSHRNIVSNGLEIDEQSRWLRYVGTVYESYYFLKTRSASDVNYSVSDGSSTFELFSASTMFSNYPQDGTFNMGGAFAVRSDTTDNQKLRAEVVEVFNVRPLAFFSEPSNIGVLQLSADDGSKLVLNADNGDFESVAIEISSSDGDSETLTQPWSLWAENLSIDEYYSW